MEILNIKDRKTRKMFLTYVDRHYVTELFPIIGRYLKEHCKKNVLNIGIEKYNIYDKSFFLNENIYFYSLDIIDKRDIIPKDWNEFYKCDLTMDINIDMPKFDVIIDYGVIGWDIINIELSYDKIEKYICNIYNLLEYDGLYFLKIDYRSCNNNNNNKLIEILHKYFSISKFYNLEEKILIQDSNTYFKTFILKKNR